MDVGADGISRASSGYATPLPGRLTQGTQLHAEVARRLNTATQRRQETATNHAYEGGKQTKQTLAEQLANIAPPRTEPQHFPLPAGDTASYTTQQSKAKSQPNRGRNSFLDQPQSSNQAPMPVVMDTSSKPKRSEPETRIEPRGKAKRLDTELKDQVLKQEKVMTAKTQKQKQRKAKVRVRRKNQESAKEKGRRRR